MALPHLYKQLIILKQLLYRFLFLIPNYSNCGRLEISGGSKAQFLPIHKNLLSTSPHSFLLVSPLPEARMKYHKNSFGETWKNKLVSKLYAYKADNLYLNWTNRGTLHSPSRTWASASRLLGANARADLPTETLPSFYSNKYFPLRNSSLL